MLDSKGFLDKLHIDVTEQNFQNQILQRIQIVSNYRRICDSPVSSVFLVFELPLSKNLLILLNFIS
jgi:hypothetical protein